MATLRDIKQRIKSVSSTQKITKAMKMVATAKLRRAQERIINARPFAFQISEMMSHLITENDLTSNPFLFNRPVKKVAVIVVTADRGLCGAFNTNILKDASKLIDAELKQQNVNSVVYCVGKKSFDYFSKRNYDVIGNVVNIFNDLKVEFAYKIAKDIINGYLKNEYDKVIIIYNEFKSIIQQRIVREDYLPIPLKIDKKKFKNSNSSRRLRSSKDGIFNLETESMDYIYEPSQKDIFNYILPKYLNAQMWRFLLESNAAELGARMTAMDNATSNADEIIRTLRIKFNKERQASITKELLEVVSGANALQSS